MMARYNLTKNLDPTSIHGMGSSARRLILTAPIFDAQIEMAKLTCPAYGFMHSCKTIQLLARVNHVTHCHWLAIGLAVRDADVFQTYH